MSILIGGGAPQSPSYKGNYTIIPTESNIVIAKNQLLTNDLTIKGVEGGSGQYAWKKSNFSKITITDKLAVTLKIISNNELSSQKIELMNNNISLDQLETEDFSDIYLYLAEETLLGVKDQSWYLGKNGVSYWCYSQYGTKFAGTYEYKDGVLTVISGMGGLTHNPGYVEVTNNISWAAGTGIGPKTIQKDIYSLTFKNFVVSNDSSKYPNNATQDGFYYTSISQ